MARAAKYIAILGLFLAAVSAAAGIVTARRYGTGAYQASAVAAILVWLVGGISLAIVASAKTSAGRLNCALLAMLIRMTLPLAALLFFQSTNDPLLADGIAGLIVVHYLAGLIVETLMSVRLASRMGASGSAGGREGISVT